MNKNISKIVAILVIMSFLAFIPITNETVEAGEVTIYIDHYADGMEVDTFSYDVAGWNGTTVWEWDQSDPDYANENGTLSLNDGNKLVALDVTAMPFRWTFNVTVPEVSDAMTLELNYSAFGQCHTGPLYDYKEDYLL